MQKHVPPNYGFGEAETEGAMLGFGEIDAAGVVAATEFAGEAAGLTDAEAAGATVDEPVGLGVAVAELVGAGETETPGTGVAEATGAGVCPWVNSRVRVLGVFALRA